MAANKTQKIFIVLKRCGILIDDLKATKIVNKTFLISIGYDFLSEPFLAKSLIDSKCE